MQPEIQAYFRGVAEQYRVVERVRFHSIVQQAEWDDHDKVWKVTVLDLNGKIRRVRRSKILVSAVGALSVPKECEMPGREDFKGRMFHSAKCKSRSVSRTADISLYTKELHLESVVLLIISSTSLMLQLKLR